MSWLAWFSPSKKKVGTPTQEAMPSSGLSRLDSTRPAHAARAHATAAPANRKQERMERRELLYMVVREAMVRAGVLSSSYKFKVLSLDTRGRQFLVMVDLAQRAASEPIRMAEIEALIAQSAKARFDIMVTAVYWRSNDHVAIGDIAARPRPSEPRPAQLGEDALVSQPAPLVAAAAPRPRPAFEPLHPSEIEAFRQALAARADRPAAPTGTHKHGSSGVLLTGFEDTEVSAEEPTHELGGTQYGELR